MVAGGEFISMKGPNSCPNVKEKRVLCSVYPNFVWAPSCFAQDDRTISLTKISKVD